MISAFRSFHFQMTDFYSLVRDFNTFAKHFFEGNVI